jgi:hypothetical protein
MLLSPLNPQFDKVVRRTRTHPITYTSMSSKVPNIVEDSESTPQKGLRDSRLSGHSMKWDHNNKGYLTGSERHAKEADKGGKGYLNQEEARSLGTKVTDQSQAHTKIRRILWFLFMLVILLCGVTAVATTTTPTSTPTPEIPVTYVPGKLTRKENGLTLSEGLTSRMVARTGQHVPLTGFGDNLMSEKMFHDQPDGAAVFEWLDTGGWIYVSNSEVITQGGGGVSAIYFDKDGNVVDYQHLLTGTTMNCSGGKTPWNTWSK